MRTTNPPDHDHPIQAQARQSQAVTAFPPAFRGPKINRHTNAYKITNNQAQLSPTLPCWCLTTSTRIPRGKRISDELNWTMIFLDLGFAG
jgi:hypothetical protein